MTSSLSKILDQVFAVWPEHSSFIDRSMRDRTTEVMETSEILASAILKMTGTDIASYCVDYQTMCGVLTEEEYNFRRTGTYRFSKYAEVADFVYHNPDYMRTYVRGLLLSQVLWQNHALMLDAYRTIFLPSAPQNGRHLEVGPGHGLLMHLALTTIGTGKFAGWDISQTSVDETRRGLATLGHDHDTYTLSLQDATAPPPVISPFDTITISEVLEHTENPLLVLKSLRGILAPSGRIFINVPVNSPAVDHIYHFRVIGEIADLAREAGYRVSEHHEYPMGGYSIEKAVKLKATISCVVIAEIL